MVRERSRYYVLVRGLTTPRPMVHALTFDWTGPDKGYVRISACGWKADDDAWSAANSDPRHVAHLPRCRRCFPDG